jgi:2',3'-cyclic-nucleotide 2'-phosphodiesterase
VKILFVGDIFGRPGRQVASVWIPKIRQKRDIDLCIVNGENAAGGFGLTEGVVGKLFSYGVDAITTGNHIWDRPDAGKLLASSTRIVRPANYHPDVPGIGYTIVRTGNNIPVGIINLQGRVFMAPIDCPFRIADKVVEILRADTSVIIVDFHAEATSEKMALGWYLNGRVSAVIGTHTHVMTADEKILFGGTAYITDSGMTGPHKSVIGVIIEQSLEKLIKQIPKRFSPAEEGLRFSGVVIEVDETSGRALSIERIFEEYDGTME